MDRFLGNLAQGSVLEFGGSQIVFDDMQDRITDDALGGGEVTGAALGIPSPLWREGRPG